MPSKLFGTDGIRGVANQPPLIPSWVAHFGEVIGRFYATGGVARVVVGRDTRRSGEMLQSALVAGLCAAGANPWVVGILPSPAVAYLTRALGAELGVVISASHNPFPDNGIKLFSHEGAKISVDEERRIEAALDDSEQGLRALRPIGENVGSVTFLVDGADRYLRGLARVLPTGLWLKGVRLVVDAANGAAFEVAPQAFQSAGATVHVVGVMPDGMNINRECGATNPEVVKAETLRTHSRAGVALDGDADRVLLIDEKGNVLDGDDVLYILARYASVMDCIRSPVVVGTIMTNLGLERALASLGMRLVRSGVGDREVSITMTREGADLGGEPSGHIILRRRANTGDGLLTALTVLELARRVGRNLSELREGFERLPQRLQNVRVQRRKPLDQLEGLKKALEAADTALAGRGRVVVRYSGTEPLVRVMVEAEEEATAERWLGEIADVLRKELGTSDEST